MLKCFSHKGTKILISEVVQDLSGLVQNRCDHLDELAQRPTQFSYSDARDLRVGSLDVQIEMHMISNLGGTERTHALCREKVSFARRGNVE